MSVFVRQNSVNSKFENSDSWVILSSIEKQIKEKIERIGTPLKDWDISINYGIKTGYNDAFIISGDKRKDLVEQDPKSAEIIRPILRGRDIKKYGCEFADLWLINTHNGIKEKGIKPIKIEDYPAIEKHLEQFHSHLEKRTDRGDTLYNLRNCAYMDDFSKQKIVWKRVGSLLKFCYDNSGIFALDSTCFATGEHIKYLVAFLNSSVGNYLLRDSPKTGTGDLLISVQAIAPIIAPIPEKKFEEQIDSLTDQLITLVNSDVEKSINASFYNLFKFSAEEIDFIEFQ